MSQILGSALPREVHVWLQSLNLTYKIQNPKRDLANGWIYAEILSRYYPEEIEMYQYDNGFKLEKKRNNWEHMQKYFKRKALPVTSADWDPVMHCAPNAAYDLLQKFYTILTGREIVSQLQPIQEQYLRDAEDPEYAKPTIAKKMKERELVRIADEKVQQDLAKTIITAHNETLRTDRVMNPDRFTYTRTQMYDDDSVYNKSNIMKYRTGYAPQMTAGESEKQMQQTGSATDVKQVQVKTANKQIRGLRHGKKDAKGGFGAGADDDNDEITFEYVLSDLIGSTLANKMGKNDPEYKNFKESFDHVIQYFLDRYNYISDELIFDIFTEINEKSADIVNVISRNMMDFCELTDFFINALKNTNPLVTSTGSTDGDNSEEKSIFKLIVETFSKLGNSILNEDPMQTEIYFLEYALDELLEIMCENDFKRNELGIVLYTFCPNTSNAHLRVLSRIKSKIQYSNKNQYVAVISDLLQYDECFDGEYLWGSADMYDFYFSVAQKGIYYNSPISRAKSLSIISRLAPCSIVPMFQMLPGIRKMVNSSNWEIQGQLLILSNCALQELCDSQYKLRTDQDEPDQDLVRLISQTYSQDECNQMIPVFLDMINQVFTIESPKATQRIGLTYLANTINSFPDLCDRYLEILLNVSQETRNDILLLQGEDEDENEQKSQVKHEYVAGCSAGKYLMFSSYQYWNQTKIIQSLEKLILHKQGEQLENLDWPHLEVLKAACRIDTSSIKDEFLKDQAHEWIRIFTNLKQYIFISLTIPEFSETAIEILETFTWRFKEVQDACLDGSLTIMIKTLGLIYQPDIDFECKENIKHYLENLYFNADENQKQKDFVYNSIKNFAEMNQKAYHGSNLIDLMNAIVQDRRGEIFPLEAPSPGRQSERQSDLMGSKASDQGHQSASAMRRTGALRKSIMASSGANYMNRNASQSKQM